MPVEGAGPAEPSPPSPAPAPPPFPAAAPLALAAADLPSAASGAVLPAPAGEEEHRGKAGCVLDVRQSNRGGRGNKDATPGESGSDSQVMQKKQAP